MSQTTNFRLTLHRDSQIRRPAIDALRTHNEIVTETIAIVVHVQVESQELKILLTSAKTVFAQLSVGPIIICRMVKRAQNCNALETNGYSKELVKMIN